MYSRIGRAKFRTDESEAVIGIAQEGAAAFRSQPGFQSVTYLYDRSSGWGFAVSHWDTREHAEAASEATRDIAAKFQQYRSNPGEPPDTVEGMLPTFEVVAQA